MAAALCRTFAGLTRRTIFSYQVRAFADQGPDKLEPTEEKRDLGTEGFHSIHPPKDSFEGKVETSETEMPSMLGHMLGEERDEILKELQGVKDQFEFEGREITSREGTRQDPILVRSEANERIVGCICDEGEVHFNYMVLNRGPARRCMCGFWFKLVQV